jgi:hypothetical protein
VATRLDTGQQYRWQPPQAASDVVSATTGDGVVAALMEDNRTVLVWGQQGSDYWDPNTNRWGAMPVQLRTYPLPQRVLQLASNSLATVALVSGEPGALADDMACCVAQSVMYSHVD